MPGTDGGDASGVLRRLIAGQCLSHAEARRLFDDVMDGRVSPPLLAAVVTAIAVRGESVDELVAAAEAMRHRATRVACDDPGAIDTCGTGGDGKPTFNVSTAVAIVAAAAGATVAKHGNRSAARPSGSAEALAALGVRVEADVPTLERCLRECRVAFLFAPALQPAMRHAAEVRRALGVRTIFNLLGPLTNPAGVRRQFMGVSRAEHVALMLQSLRRLGAERAMVVHGREGLCDLSIAGPSLVGTWDGLRERLEEVDVRAVGVPAAPIESCYVGSPRESAAWIERVLDGQSGAPRDMVVFNTAGALWAAGLAADWTDGAARAVVAIDSGAARARLEHWRRVSHGEGA